MFAKSKEQGNTAFSSATGAGGSTFSILGADVEIVGNISARVDLHVDGKVTGDVKCASLVQGRDSFIAGCVLAETARLGGTVDGSIEVGELLIEASARITGDVVYEKLTIEPGGQVDGKFQHKGNNAPPIARMTAAVPRDAEQGASAA